MCILHRKSETEYKIYLENLMEMGHFIENNTQNRSLGNNVSNKRLSQE
jgi:hypothetical protein